MTDRLPIWRKIPIIIGATLLSPITAVVGDEPRPDAIYRQYYVDATLFSLKPGDEMATFRGYSGGGVGPHGTIGTGVVDRGRWFAVEITGKLTSNRFAAVVKITPEKQDTRTRPQEKEYDLTDLQPKSLELARDDDGRVYRLNLLPRIQESPQPKQFKVRDLNLEAWNFPSSPVVVNDEDYAGELGGGTNPIAQFDVPGFAKIEFSLLHLKDASPIGTLKDGVINITHPTGTTVRISNVMNGANREVLAGGPYQVWVRWDKPRESLEEFRKTFKAMIAEMKDQAKKGETQWPPGHLERLEKISETGRAHIMEFEIRAAEPSDLAEPAEKP